MDVLDRATVANVNEKGFVPDEVRNAFFRKLRMKSENRSCFECTARNPTWISLSYGVYLCLECSGEHRRKGVHISFVRSVELDSFTPEQMMQMAVGGNGKAWEYFKQSGMGKLSDGGRSIDYNSGITKRYKAKMEQETEEGCKKVGISYKEPLKAPSVLALEKAKTDPVDEATDFSFDGKVAEPAAPSQLARHQTAPAATSGGYPGAAAPKAAAAKAASTIHTVSASSVTSSNMKVVGPTASSSAQLAAATAVSSSNVPKPSGFAAKQKAKEIDFDFDFDDLEAEAAKPPPAPIPKVSSAPAPAPAPTKTFSAPAAPSRNGANGSSAADDLLSKYSGKKGISSADFFHEEQQESAHARLERESRYQKFSGSGAISSASFFGEGDPSDDFQRSNSGEGSEDWKAMAKQGSDMAKAGISKGAELLTAYLNKART